MVTLLVRSRPDSRKAEAMARSVKALINPELLEWARKTTHMSVAEAAKKAKITYGSEAGSGRLFSRSNTEL